MKLRIHNGGSRETLNQLHVRCCEMLHFVTRIKAQYKQLLDNAQLSTSPSWARFHF